MLSKHTTFLFVITEEANKLLRKEAKAIEKSHGWEEEFKMYILRLDKTRKLLE